MTDVIDILNAASKTISHPSVEVLAEDLVLVHELVDQVKKKLDGKHPTLLDIFSVLLFNK